MIIFETLYMLFVLQSSLENIYSLLGLWSTASLSWLLLSSEIQESALGKKLLRQCV